MNSSTPLPEISPRYTGTALLGVGGMAIVYQARDLVTHQNVALKMLKNEYAHDPIRKQRFQQEYDLLRCFNSSAIIAVHDSGVTTQGIPFYTMELLSGTILAHHLTSRKEISLQPSLQILYPLACALKEIHDRGIVFCDLTPSNISVDTARGSVTIMDFGIAQKLIGTHTEPLTTKVGTPEYMSPEQYQMAPLTIASDIYSFGVVAYELLTGKLPFDPEVAYKVEFFHKLVEVPSLRSYNPAISPSLDRLVRRCLEKDISHRFTSFAPIIDRLRDLLDHHEKPSLITRCYNWLTRSAKK